MAWLRVLALGLLGAVLLIATLELRLAAQGFRATAEDSEERWLEQRQRASELGPQALILIGASRMQLDIDTSVLRRTTGLEPVQLAIDGSSFLPVLEGLAADDSIRGSVLVSYMDHILADPQRNDVARVWQQSYSRLGQGGDRSLANRFEAMLATGITRHLRSYADGTRPISALLGRALNSEAQAQYIWMLPDRSRLADYRRVDLPGFYFARVIRNLGETPVFPEGISGPEVERLLQARVADLPAADNRRFLDQVEVIDGWVRRIEARGGRVLFAVLPTSGLIREIDRRRYPRAQFWDQFRTRLARPAVHFEDHDSLRRFQCPDGSHLDYRDRPAFTEALVNAIARERAQAGA